VRYDISLDPTQDKGKGRWHITASWGIDSRPVGSLEQLRYGPVLHVDLNDGHLDIGVTDPSGNPICPPITIPLILKGLSASTRDGHLRAAITQILNLAEQYHAGAIVIEDLGFERYRAEGREHTGNRPSRGKKGRAWRRRISGLPTGKFRDRLVQMAYNRGFAVIAVDPRTPVCGAHSTG
jgi:IS605 OrfB family transposase